MERYPGDAAAANDFGRNWLQDWEARLLYEAGYPAPPDMRVPGNWRLSQMGLLVPPIPTSEDRLVEIRAARERMTDKQRANPIWDQENNVSWNAYFAARRRWQIEDYTGPPPAPKHANTEGRKRWWGVPGRSLTYVLGYIEDGNEPRLQAPSRTPDVPVRRGWMPRRMSASSSSSSGAFRSASSVLRTLLARVKDEPPRTRYSRAIVIRETGEGRLLTLKKEPVTGGSSLDRALKKAFKDRKSVV